MHSFSCCNHMVLSCRCMICHGLIRWHSGGGVVMVCGPRGEPSNTIIITLESWVVAWFSYINGV